MWVLNVGAPVKVEGEAAFTTFWIKTYYNNIILDDMLPSNYLSYTFSD